MKSTCGMLKSVSFCTTTARKFYLVLTWLACQPADQAIPFHHDFLQTKFNNKNNWNFSGFYPLFQVELEFGNVGFCGGRKTGVSGEKPSEQGRELTHKLNPQMTPNPGIEPGSHWWEASALT